MGKLKPHQLGAVATLMRLPGPKLPGNISLFFPDDLLQFVGRHWSQQDRVNRFRQASAVPGRTHALRSRTLQISNGPPSMSVNTPRKISATIRTRCGTLKSFTICLRSASCGEAIADSLTLRASAIQPSAIQACAIQPSANQPWHSLIGWVSRAITQISLISGSVPAINSWIFSRIFSSIIMPSWFG
jgi:hypothetical protein